MTEPAPSLTWQPSLLGGASEPAIDVQFGALTRIELDVQGVHCSACVWLFDTLFRRMNGSASIVVNPAVGRPLVAMVWVQGGPQSWAPGGRDCWFPSGTMAFTSGSDPELFRSNDSSPVEENYRHGRAHSSDRSSAAAPLAASYLARITNLRVWQTPSVRSTAE